MKQVLSAAAVAFVTLPLGIVAGQHAGADTQSANAEPRQVVVTGCVERLSDTHGRASAKLESTGATEGSLALTHAVPFTGSNAAAMASGSRGNESTATGTSGAARSPGRTQTYRFAQNSLEQATAHVGEKVEIRGTVTVPAGAPTAGRERDVESTTEPPAPVLTVQSIRMLSASCSE